jgi:ABC-type Fe3+-hydroxamate transport system substrate-binding protein
MTNSFAPINPEAKTDQMGRTLELGGTPSRIVSLVPSQTELLYALGLNEEVVGITKFCVHPDSWFRSKTRVGGTKNPDLERIRSLKPDLIIGNKEENEQESMEALMQEFPVWMSDIRTLEQALSMIRSVGELTGRKMKAEDLIAEIRKRFSNLEVPGKKSRAAYLIWKNPYIAAGSSTFINEMMNFCGFTNVFEEERYPEISVPKLKAADPEYILLSSEPYPFSAKHVSEFSQICPLAKIIPVDGELFSWYGSRLLLAPRYFSGLRLK